MKKSIITLSAMLFLAVGVANAQTEEAVVQEAPQVEAVEEAEQAEEVNEAAQAQVVDQDSRVEIKEDALPVKVQEVLKSDRFNTWDVSKVYETAKDDKKVYEVVLQNGEKKATYKFDAEGKTIG